MATVTSQDREGGVRMLTLDRPSANAIDERLLEDLRDALTTAREDAAVRAIVLTGAGRFFCGGFDFAAPRRDGSAARAMQVLYRRSHLDLLAFPKPTVAMVNGHAIAGGFVLALACDYRLGLDADYRVGLNEIAVGAGFPLAAVEIIRLRLPHARAAELMLGGALYPATQAPRLGLVDELLPAETFEATVLRRAARLGSFPRAAYQHTKMTLVADAVGRIEAEREDEAAATEAVWRDEESRTARRTQRAKLGIGS